MKLHARIRHAARYRIQGPAVYLSDLARARLSRTRRAGVSAAPVRVLLASDSLEYTSEQQFAPLHAYRAELRDQLGVVVNPLLVNDVLSLPRVLLRAYDLVLFKLSFRTQAAEVLDIGRRLRARIAPAARLVYADGDDDACIQWPGLLPIVDLYLKKHVFSDASAYGRRYTGKNNLTDYVARRYGVSFTSDIVPTSQPVPPEEFGKIYLGWNVALDDKIRAVYEQNRHRRDAFTKDCDVICRATVSPEAWIHPLRADIVPRLRSLEPQLRVVTPEQRVPQDQYYAEMRRSHMCVSPFGYGEICWRDFEAVLCRCLVLKPDVSHLRTHPNLFVPGETYVPVSWDYEDLEEKCRYYAEHPDERLRIVERAHATLDAYYRNYGFLNDFTQLLQRLGFGAAPQLVRA